MTKLGKVAAFDIRMQPSAEREGAILSTEEDPGLPSLGVVGDVQVVKQVFSSLTFGQLSVAKLQYGTAAVWLLADLVNNAVANRHWHTSVWCRPPPPVTGCNMMAIWF